MMVNVANPIYDTIFKYLMEDERIAKTILSALLKKDVRKVVMRPHEYSNTTRDTLSMFRVDFSATVADENGKESILTIELQKTWLPTETLRFRQYLGLQYNNKKNIQENTKKKYAYPLVAVYLLGHRVGNIEEPVVYVNHKVYDYNGNEVANGSNNPFVESLTHNSIIVQIPLLRGKVSNRLDKVLSMFDQSKITESHNPQVLTLNEADYANDSDLMYMLHRLTAAAADAEMRQDMNVEDEYFELLEERETTILKKNKKLKEQDRQLKEQDKQLKEQDTQLKEQDTQLKEQDKQLKDKDEQLSQKDEQLSQKDEQIRALAQIMSSNGTAIEVIANALHLSTDEVTQLLSE